jgi:hypothetical protein
MAGSPNMAWCCGWVRNTAMSSRRVSYCSAICTTANRARWARRAAEPVGSGHRTTVSEQWLAVSGHSSGHCTTDCIEMTTSTVCTDDDGIHDGSISCHVALNATPGAKITATVGLLSMDEYTRARCVSRVAWRWRRCQPLTAHSLCRLQGSGSVHPRKTAQETYQPESQMHGHCEYQWLSHMRRSAEPQVTI